VEQQQALVGNPLFFVLLLGNDGKFILSIFLSAQNVVIFPDKWLELQTAG
jgi:hypothetical protein